MVIDYLGNEQNETVGLYCGNARVPDLITTKNKVTIHFLTSPFGSGEGFNITYREVSSRGNREILLFIFPLFVSFIFVCLFHWGCTHLTLFHCMLNDWMNIEKIHFHLQLAFAFKYVFLNIYVTTLILNNAYFILIFVEAKFFMWSQLW